MNTRTKRPFYGGLFGLGLVLLACSLPLSAGDAENAPAAEDAAPAAAQAAPVEEVPVEAESPAEAPEAPAAVDAQGCTHYVSPGGDDGNTGNGDAPWKTIQHAAESAGPGYVVCIMPGTYVGDGGLVELTASGSADQPLAFTAPGGEVVIEGAIDIPRGVSHLQLHNLTVHNTGSWGITLYGDNEGILLSGLEVSGGEASVHFTVGDSGEAPQYGPVNNITIRDSVFHDVVYTAVDCTPGPCNDMIFKNLEIYGAGMGAESSYGSDGLAVERGRNILVEDCYIHDNSGDGIDLNSRDAMLGEETGQIIVRRNRVQNNLLNGIKLWRGGEASNNVVWTLGNTLLVLERGGNYVIVNNTFATSTDQVYLISIGYDPFPGSTSVKLFNNIFFNDNPAMGGTQLYVSETVDLAAGHNLYFNPYREEDVICIEDTCFNKDQINDGSYSAQTGVGENSMYSDPLFSDAANGDLHLTGDSPALDAGSSDYAPDGDLEGNTRPQGTAPDIGAYEAGSG